MIDPATGWFKIQQYDDKQSITVANIIEQEWFSRYPWPTQVTLTEVVDLLDNDFQKMIKEDYGGKAKTHYSQKPTGKRHRREGSQSYRKYYPYF